MTTRKRNIGYTMMAAAAGFWVGNNLFNGDYWQALAWACVVLVSLLEIDDDRTR